MVCVDKNQRDSLSEMNVEIFCRVLDGVKSGQTSKGVKTNVKIISNIVVMIKINYA